MSVLGRPRAGVAIGVTLGRALIALATVSTVALAALAVSAPEQELTWIVTAAFQAMAIASGAAACAIFTRHTRGRARLTWILLAAGLGTWALADIAFALCLALGQDVPEVSLLDVVWLASNVPLLAGVGLVYAHLRPERGWQGALDGLVFALAVGLVAWLVVLDELAASGSEGMLGTLVSVGYPGCDLIGLSVLSWLALRRAASLPRWFWYVFVAYALQVGAGGVYLELQLQGLAYSDALAAAGYSAAGWMWVAAAVARRRDPAPVTARVRRDAPPAWSQALPFGLAVAMEVVVLLAPRDPVLTVLALVGAGLATARVVATLVTNRRLLVERQRLLVTDPLTGAYNRRFFTDELRRSFARAERSHQPLALVGFDLDRFKEVNDRNGHGAGDELLVAVVARAGESLRAGDMLCRLGGDEFVVIAPDAGPVDGLAIGERIRSAVRTCAGDRVHLSVTASVGIAVFPDHVDDPDQLAHRVDQAVYIAKTEGRDRTAVYESRRAAAAETYRRMSQDAALTETGSARPAIAFLPELGA